MKTILLILCLLCLASCTVNRYLPQPNTVKVTNSGTFVTFSNRPGNWIITDTSKVKDSFGYRINVVSVNLYYGLY